MMSSKTKYTLWMCGLLSLLWTCQSQSAKLGQSKTGTYLGIFQERFKQVIKNSDNKIKIRIELSHKDGSYITGDEPFLFLTTNKSAHIRLLYITCDEAILQKFPPLNIADSSGSQLFINDYINADMRHRIPQVDGLYKYRVQLPVNIEKAQELVIAIASSVPFTSLDSLIAVKRQRDPRKYSESPVKSNVLNLGILFYPQAGILKWAPYVFDLFAHVFLGKRSGYAFGYEYKVITISK